MHVCIYISNTSQICFELLLDHTTPTKHTRRRRRHRHRLHSLTAHITCTFTHAHARMHSLNIYVNANTNYANAPHYTAHRRLHMRTRSSNNNSPASPAALSHRECSLATARSPVTQSLAAADTAAAAAASEHLVCVYALTPKRFYHATHLNGISF